LIELPALTEVVIYEAVIQQDCDFVPSMARLARSFVQLNENRFRVLENHARGPKTPGIELMKYGSVSHKHETNHEITPIGVE